VATLSNPKHHLFTQTQRKTHKESYSKMSSSRNLEEVAEQALKEKSQALQEKEEAEARVKYLQTQLA